MTEQESLARYRENCFKDAQERFSLIHSILNAPPSAGFSTPESKLRAITVQVNEYRKTVDGEAEDHCARFPDSDI